MATHEEICDRALENYRDGADISGSWSNTVEKAIKFYASKPALEAERNLLRADLKETLDVLQNLVAGLDDTYGYVEIASKHLEKSGRQL